MSNISVDDLARKLRVQSKLILQMLNSLDIPVESAETRIDESVASAVSTVILQERAQRKAANEAKKKAAAAAATAKPEEGAVAADKRQAERPAAHKAEEAGANASRETAAKAAETTTSVQAPQRERSVAAPVQPSEVKPEIKTESRPESITESKQDSNPSVSRPVASSPRPADQGQGQQRPPQAAGGQPGQQAQPRPQGQPGPRPQGPAPQPGAPRPMQQQQPRPQGQGQGQRPPQVAGGQPVQQGPRPAGQGQVQSQRPPQGAGWQQSQPVQQGPRPAPQGQGQQRPPQGAGWQQGQPGQQRPMGPRPQGAAGSQGQGGQGQPRPYAPRPQGQQGPGAGGQQGRPNYGPRPPGQGQGGQGQGGRPPYPPRDGQAPRPGQGGGGRPGGGGPGRPGGTGQGRPGGGRPGGGPFIPQPQQPDKPATPSTKIVKKDLKYSDERYRDQDRQFSSEGEQQQRRSGRSGGGSSRRNAPSRRSAEQRSNTQMPSQIELAGAITVKGLADLLKTDGATIIKKLMQFGMLVTINQEIDFETATIVATDLGSSVVAPKEAYNPESIVAEEDDEDVDLVSRPPVVTVMGHVDHGKTSLLDAIRSANVVSGEAGGITQHIGAYTVELDGRKITFLDTPGHAAFTAMRARGAQVTDIAILVVAADDGVMPQTVEAINHAKAANVPIIVAINKIDKPGANPERVKQELTEYELIAEEWGGDTVMVPVSAIRGDGLEELLESVLLVADIAELKANPDRRAVGTVIEAKLDRGRGPVATILVHKGTLHIGDILVVGSTFGKIRAMVDDKGRRVKSAGPSQPVEVVGLTEVPDASDSCNAVEDERQARVLAETRAMLKKQEEQARSGRVTLEDLFSKMQEGETKDLNLIVKGDVHGSVEALRLSLERLSTKEVRVVIVHTGVGAISESDIMLAAASGAIIIGFNVRPDANAQKIAEQQNVDIRTYRIIYEILDDVEAAMKGMLAPVIKENIIAHVEVREIFRVSKVGNIAGCYVLDGKITRSAMVRVVRDGAVIHEGKIASLRRIKDDVREVASGYECGILLERFNDIKEGDRFEAYVMEEIKRTEL